MKIVRRQVLQAGLAAGALTAAPALGGPSKASDISEPRRRMLLDNGWRFHLGRAAEMERDFGWGRDQRTFRQGGRSHRRRGANGFRR